MIPLTDTWTQSRSPLRAEKPLEQAIGAASPLWLLFAGAAATGVAYWWMSQWVKPVNLEAIMGLAERSAAPAMTPPAEGRSFQPAAVGEPAELQASVEPAFAPPADQAEVAAEVIAAPVVAAVEAVKEVLATPEPATPKTKPKFKAGPPSDA